MKLTVIIPVATDIRIVDCINSVDEHCEILVVANEATSEVLALLDGLRREHGINVLVIPERNLGLARDRGIRHAKNRKILLMDSDCIFKKGTIRKLYHGLDTYEIAKGRVIFTSRGFASRVISRVREYTTSDKVSAYAPPLALRKSILKKIGGYYFDSDIHWVDDAELDLRVRKSRIKIKYVPDAEIFHPPLTCVGDLTSAFRYGYGKKIGVRKGLMKGVGAFWKDTPAVAREKGIFASLYLVIWNVLYCIGFFAEPFIDIYGVNFRLNRLGKEKE